MVPGLEMATRMVMEICGGMPSENVVVGNAYGDDRVIDVFGADRATFPGSAAQCISAITLGDDDSLYVADACAGFLVKLTSETR